MFTAEKQLLSILKTIEGKGSFVTSGLDKFVLPGLRIEGADEIGFPAIWSGSFSPLGIGKS